MVGIRIIWARDRMASGLAGLGNGWHPDGLDTGMVGIRIIWARERMASGLDGHWNGWNPEMVGPGNGWNQFVFRTRMFNKKGWKFIYLDTWGTGGGVGGGGGLLQEGAGLPHHMKNQKCGACDENHVVNSHCRYNLIGFLLNWLINWWMYWLIDSFIDVLIDRY